MTEKVIELQEVKSNNDEVTSPKIETRIIEKKPVTKLTQEEKDIIIQCYKEGKEQPNYTVSESKTGKLKIVKSKSEDGKKLEKEPKVIVNTPTNDGDNVVKRAKSNSQDETSSRLTNEQMMILNIMELNSRMEVLTNKHKKLKKKYKKMKNDIYVDDDEVDGVVDVNELEKKLQVTPNVDETQNNNDTQIQISQPVPPNERQVYTPIYKGKGWRQKVKYI